MWCPILRSRGPRRPEPWCTTRHQDRSYREDDRQQQNHGEPRMAHRGPLSRKSPGTPPTVETALTYPMRRRIPTAHVAVARTAPTLHRLRLGSRSASAIRPHAAARRTACTCDQAARTRAPDTRATRPWILLGGCSWCAARAHRPGWARRAIDARPSTPSPQGGTRRRRKTSSSVLATRTPPWRTRTRAARPSRRAARPSRGERRLAGRPPPRSRCARSRRR